MSGATLLELAEMESRFPGTAEAIVSGEGESAEAPPNVTAQEIDPLDLAAAILRAQGGLGK